MNANAAAALWWRLKRHIYHMGGLNRFARMEMGRVARDAFRAGFKYGTSRELGLNVKVCE